MDKNSKGTQSNNSKKVSNFEMKPVTLIIGGDLCPTKTNFHLFSNSNIDRIIGKELNNILSSADIRVFNLETPLSDIKKPIKKYGPNLAAPISTINGIKSLNPTLLCLANNHILDQDEQGLFSTIEILRKVNIGYFGAGKNLADARKPAIIEKNNIKIGFYACTEHEFSNATEISAGANPFDPLESLDHIKNLKDMCDYLIVLYHGGKELYPYPSPNLQKVCRKIVDRGANLVVCQHSHCIGTIEEYNGSTIIYGQGNFIFDYSDHEAWQTGLLLKVTFLDKKASIDYIPICKNEEIVRIASDVERDKIISELISRSKNITIPGFIEKEYSKFCRKIRNGYLRLLAGFNPLVSRFDRLTGGFLVTIIYNKKNVKAIENIIECEAHREIILRQLRDYNISTKKNK